MELEVIEVNNLLKIYCATKEIAVHTVSTLEKGRYVTDPSHYPSSKTISHSDITNTQQREMSQIGLDASAFYEAFYNRNSNVGKYDYRTITGVLSLRKKYDNATINAACKRAVYYRSMTYSTVRKICEKGLITLPIETNISYIATMTSPLARDLQAYTNLCEIGGVEYE